MIISKELERKVRFLSKELFFIDTPLKTQGTHQIELKSKSNSNDYCYIARKVGIKKDEFQIVINPKVDKEKIDKLLAIDGVKLAINRKTKNQFFHSSQYVGFKNKGVSGDEHYGVGFRIDITSDLLSLRMFLETFKK